MYGPAHAHSRSWPGTTNRPDRGIRPIGQATATNVIALPVPRPSLAGGEAAGVDRALRARFWQLALPVLGLFWLGVAWGIVG